MYAIRALLQSSIDYAGLFPPAGLDMRSAVQNYAHYRVGDHAWALGRFIVPTSRLDEFDAATADLLPQRAYGAPWPIAALIGSVPAADFERLEEFNRRHAADDAGAATIDTVELRASSTDAIDTAFEAMPGGIQAYVEIPIDADPAQLIATIAARGGRAKVRTGGVTTEAFPTVAHLLRFIRRCAEACVPFKATAGLHHPLRAEHRLTYAPDSPSDTMHGFMNLYLAAAFMLAGMSDADVSMLLEERSSEAFRFDSTGIEWRGHRLSLDAIDNARTRAIIGFGSCSFTEPVADLTSLDWL